MIKKLWIFSLVLVCLFTLSLAVGAINIKVGMVTDIGGLGDQSFNDAAYRGLVMLQDKYGVEITVVESALMTDYVDNLSSLAEQGFDMVWAVGFLMQDALAEVAELYPETKFGLIDAVVDAPNVKSVTFEEQQGSFLVGLFAAQKTKVDKIGFIGGMDFPLIHKFEAGFRAGVKAVNPDAEIIIGYTGVFDDVLKGKELALTQFSQGADVIYHASGACGIGVIKAAQEKGPDYFAIGVDSPQAHLAPDSVLTSMLKRVDLAVYDGSKTLLREQWTPGHVVLGLAQNGVGYSDQALKMFDQETIELVDGYSLLIQAGDVKVPASREEFSQMYGE
ncbi:MAG: BMP family ABC transporter substrate-binding protein [Halanaerobiales bacterium]|nr:BMP family ABC transporter substrate-binding protein [Halanaerobiales bacterium]